MGSLFLGGSVNDIKTYYSNVNKTIELMGDEHEIYEIKNDKGETIIYAYSWDKKTISYIEVLSSKYILNNKIHVGTQYKNIKKKYGKCEKEFWDDDVGAGLFVFCEKLKNIKFYFNENVLPTHPNEFGPDLKSEIPDISEIIKITISK